MSRGAFALKYIDGKIESRVDFKEFNGSDFSNIIVYIECMLNDLRKKYMDTITK